MLNVEETITQRKGQQRVASAEIEHRRIERWLEEHIATGADEATSVIVTLTPALASLLLARNPDNRSISKTNLERIKSDLAAGRWSFNGESIVVSVDGRLNDGQHRCLAVVETGRSMRVSMVFGAPRESRLTVDQGTARTSGNYLSMSGLKDSNTVATVAKHILQYREYGRLGANPHELPTKAQILDVATHTAGLVEAVEYFQRGRLPAERSLLAFCRWAMLQRGAQHDVDLYFDALIDGINLSAGSPIRYVRNRLLDRGWTGRLRSSERAELIFRAWNAEREGRLNTKSLPVLGGTLPKLER